MKKTDIKLLSNDKFSDQSKLKAFADETINETERMEFL